MKKIISLFPHLELLEFSLGPGYWYEDKELRKDIKIAHVKDWELVCPGLSSVIFMDGSTLEKKSGDWIEYPSNVFIGNTF